MMLQSSQASRVRLVHPLFGSYRYQTGIGIRTEGPPEPSYQRRTMCGDDEYPRMALGHGLGRKIGAFHKPQSCTDGMYRAVVRQDGPGLTCSSTLLLSCPVLCSSEDFHVWEGPMRLAEDDSPNSRKPRPIVVMVRNSKYEVLSVTRETHHTSCRPKAFSSSFFFFLPAPRALHTICVNKKQK